MSAISRRDILRNLAIGAAGGSALRVIPVEAAALAHKMIETEKATSAAGTYAPKYFSAHQYSMLLALCKSIIPKDEKSGGALEAGSPEFIDLLTSENEDFQAVLGGGLMWLDNFCSDRYNHVFLECTAEQQKEVLDLIAFRKNAKIDPALSQGVAFFARLRNLTCDGFYTSKIGIADLQYIGNTALAEFPGCPPVPE
jgi:Gluconate 2-dehydrogenase subunit 3